MAEELSSAESQAKGRQGNDTCGSGDFKDRPGISQVASTRTGNEQERIARDARGSRSKYSGGHNMKDVLICFAVGIPIFFIAPILSDTYFCGALAGIAYGAISGLAMGWRT